jgi:hypothetical protein
MRAGTEIRDKIPPPAKPLGRRARIAHESSPTAWEIDDVTDDGFQIFKEQTLLNPAQELTIAYSAANFSPQIWPPAVQVAFLE